MRGEVGGSGPWRAPLLFIGEAPGKNEVIKGRPFVGLTGRFVRRTIEDSGLDPEDVRFNNAIPYLAKIPPDARARDALVAKWVSHLDTDLARCTASVIVACGGVALARMRMAGVEGLPSSIKVAHGGVYPWWDGKLVIPCLHPAGVMRGKIQAEKLAVERVIRRAVHYATGRLTYAPQTPRLRENPSVREVAEALSSARVICIDTEFDPKAKRTTMVGFTTDVDDGKVVYSIGHRCFGRADWPAMQQVLRRHMARRDLIKVAQHHFAEAQAMEWLDIDVSEPWFDTMYVFAALYPDLPHGLSHIARFYLDDIQDWKHMGTDDPEYNALDVAYTWRVYEALRIEIADAGMWDVIEKEVLPTLPLLYGMQRRGLAVDAEVRKEMVASNRKRIKALRLTVKAVVDEMFEARKRPLEEGIAAAERHIKSQEENAHANWYNTCPVKGHHVYTGLRKKKWTTNKQCKCFNIFEDDISLGRRERISSSRKEITKAKGKLKKWAKTGFDPGNNDHLRWLLYDKAALGLRVQKSRTTGNATADATAIAKLLALKSTPASAAPILKGIKRVQSLEKENSTFLDPPIEDGYVHPQYRMVTGTGRPASGSDEFLNEKGASGDKYNVLNIPEHVRRIYVP